MAPRVWRLAPDVACQLILWQIPWELRIYTKTNCTRTHVKPSSLKMTIYFEALTAENPDSGSNINSTMDRSMDIICDAVVPFADIVWPNYVTCCWKCFRGRRTASLLFFLLSILRIIIADRSIVCSRRSIYLPALLNLKKRQAGEGDGAFIDVTMSTFWSSSGATPCWRTLWCNSHMRSSSLPSCIGQFAEV